MAGEKVELTRKVAAVLVVAFGIIAIGAVVFLLNADGNITAYIVGGVVLAIALFAVVSAITGKKKR